MVEEKKQYDESAELKRVNDELLKRRAAARDDLLKENGDLYAAIMTHLLYGEYEFALQLALGFRETQLFSEIAGLFQKYPETFKCKACGKATDPLAFKNDSLSWIHAHLCDTCENRAKEMEIERQSRSFSRFVDLNIDKILQVAGVSGRLLTCSYEGLSSTVLETCKRSVMGKHGLYIYGEVGEEFPVCRQLCLRM